MAIIAAIASFGLLLLREPTFVAEATFKQGAKSNEIGLSLKETYQQLFAPPSEGATVAIMQSKEVLKGAIEALGLQADCPLDFRIVRAIKRARDNLLLELFRRTPSDLDLFVFRNVSYSGEKPLKLFLQLTEGGRYQILDENKTPLGEKKLGEPVAFSLGAVTVRKAPSAAKLGKLYLLTLRPFPDVATAIAKRMKIAPIKQDKNILKLEFSSRNRFLTADFINHLMKSYQTYLKRENDETCQAQLTYLCQRQQELTQYYDEALVDHMEYLKDNLNKNGCVGVAQEIEILSQPKNIYMSRLFDVDLELRRLSSRSLQKKQEEPIYYSLEVEEVGNQIREANLLLECVEKQEQIPPLPSLCKDPKSAVSQLMKQISLASIPWIRQLRNQLVQKQKILEENADLQNVSDFSGIKLETAQELLSGYARERDNLQAHLRELVFLRDQIFQPDFEISSLGGVFHDSVTADLIQKAGAIALQLKDSDNRSEREQSRLQEALQTQKNFLSQYLLQTIELKKLKAKLLDDKIGSLRSTTSGLLQSEKELLAEKLTELNQNMGELPEKWRREALLEMRKSSAQ